MVNFKMGQYRIWLADRAGVHNIVFIIFLPFLSSVQNMQELAFGVMTYFETYCKQERGTWLRNRPDRVFVMCMF